MKHKTFPLVFKRSLSFYKGLLSGMFILISLGFISIIQLNVCDMTDGKRLRGGREERLRKATLYHEQTVAVLQYLYDQPVECDLILAESSATSLTTLNQTDTFNKFTTLESQNFPIESNWSKIENLFDTRFFPLEALEQAKIYHRGRILSLVLFPEFNNDSLSTFCTLKIVDESIKNNLLESLGMESDIIREVPFQEMTSIIDTCNTLDKEINPNGSKDLIKNDPEMKEGEKLEDVYFKSIFSGIVPGTKWCGINDIAINYHDIGEEQDLDRCCRAHDHCPIKVKAFQSNYGTFNFHPYTKSHCYCDNVLYDCLKRIMTNDSSTDTDLKKAHTIGNIYFNVIGIECIEPKFPVHCLESMNEDGIVTSHESLDIYRHPNLPIRRFRRSFNFGRSNDEKTDNNEQKDKCVKWTVDRSREPKYFQVRPKKRF